MRSVLVAVLAVNKTHRKDIASVSDMSWKSTVYGDENPSRITVMVYNGIFIGFFLWFYGWWADFVPSKLWIYAGSGIAIILTILCSYWGFVAGKLALGFAGIITPLFMFVLFWVVMVHGLAAIATLMAGSPHSVVTELHKTHHLSRYACDDRLEGEILGHAVPDHLCIPYAVYSAPGESISVRLVGKTTLLGFYIQDAFVADDPEKASILTTTRF